MPPFPYRMQQAGKALVLALAFAASASSASATVFTGSTTDPADRPTDPARDIKQISTSFDNASGRWVGAVEFYGSPTPSTIAKVYLGLIESSLGTCVNLGGPGIRADIGTQQTSVGYAQPCSKPTNVPVPTRSLSSDGRQLLVDVTDPDLIGTTPTASSATRLSQDNEYYDEVPRFPLRATGGPAQGPGSAGAVTIGAGCGENGPTKSEEKPTARLPSTMVLRYTGSVRMRVTGTNQIAGATVRLIQRGGRKVGGTASGTYTCIDPAYKTTGAPLTDYGRRLVRRHGSLQVTVVFHLINGSGVTNTIERKATIRLELTAADLIGRRTTVGVTQLLTYDDPAKSYTGSLQRGQSIKISRLSRTKTYAYGFAYGKVDKAVWVRTSRLLTGS